MSITTRLAISFAVTLALAIGATVAAIRISLEHERILERLNQVHVRGAVSLANGMDALWRLRYGFPQFMVLGPEDRQRIVAEEPKHYATIERSLKEYSASHRTEQEEDALRELQASLRRYVEARPKWFELYGSGRVEEAATWRARNTTPFGADAVAAFERQIDLQQDIAQRQIERSLNEARTARIVVFLVLTALLAAVLLIFVFSMRMLRPLKTLRRDAEAKVRELFGDDISVHDGDEIESLEKAFRNLTARFVSHTRELTEMREALARERSGLEQTVAERTAELSRLARGSEQQAVEATLLYEMADRLQSCQSVAEAGEVVRMFGPQLFPDQPGALYVIRASRNMLEPVVGWGGEGLEQPFAPEDCWALRRGKPHRVADAKRELVCAHVEAPVVHPYLCAPLIAHGESIGLLHLRAAPGAPAEEAHAARLIAGATSQIGLAIGNLRLRETLRVQSLRDPLTGLFNRRFLDETLAREAARAARKKLPLTVLMVDVDHFKRFNDSFGHEAGDIALRALGDLMREQVRVSDYCCRYGGEEFTVVMPEAPLEAARERAESLRAAVARLVLQQGSHALGPITISVGLATLPLHGETPEALLQAADAALYRAKEAGRNRVVVGE